MLPILIYDADIENVEGLSAQKYFVSKKTGNTMKEIIRRKTCVITNKTGRLL